MLHNVAPRERTLERTQLLEQETHGLNLVLWNDDVNTFDWVIESLCTVCGHEPIQAEQCAWIVHTKGKCSVKQGTYEDLRPRYDALLDRGLTVTLE